MNAIIEENFESDHLSVRDTEHYHIFMGRYDFYVIIKYINLRYEPSFITKE